MRIALVHDDLTQRGGAERVVAAMHGVWPDAPIFTSVYDPQGTFPIFEKADVRTSFLQKVPLASSARHNKKFLALYPLAFETLDLRGYDVVLSSSTRFGHGILTEPDTMHICYCHAPMRFAWRYHEYITEGSFGRAEQLFLPGMIHRLRLWDFAAAQRVDRFLTNSANISRRIWKHYRREADVLHPPADTKRFSVVENPAADYLLVVSRLLPYKRVDLAVEACTRLGLNLKVVGTGPDLTRLKSLAGPTVTFLGRLPDGEIETLFSNCRAFLFPGEEDFGIAPIEAMASGRPVIAFGAGGALESVVENQTGIFFAEPTAGSLAEALGRLDSLEFSPAELRRHAETFDSAVFASELERKVTESWAVFQERGR